MGHYPHFCNESNLEEYDYGVYDTCKRELATLFAHFNQEAGELRYTIENNCDANFEDADGPGSDECNYKSDSDGWAGKYFPSGDDVQYFGRGPLQLSWNYNYGAFSEVLIENQYDSRMYLLEDPDYILSDDYLMYFSAFWFYMTPHWPAPSIHDIVAGYYVPNAADSNAGIVSGFGATINIVNGG